MSFFYYVTVFVYSLYHLRSTFFNLFQLFTTSSLFLLLSTYTTIHRILSNNHLHIRHLLNLFRSHTFAVYIHFPFKLWHCDSLITTAMNVIPHSSPPAAPSLFSLSQPGPFPALPGATSGRCHHRLPRFPLPSW